MPSPAAARGVEVRQRLLAAAAELVAERGWTAVSTRVLADRAGVTPSVVHYHFASVTALLNEAAAGVIGRAFDEVAAVFDTAPTPAAAIDGILTTASSYTGADPAALLAIEAYLAATRDEQLHAEIAGVLTGFRQRLATLLTAHGVPAPAATADVITAAIDGLLLHRSLTTDTDPDPTHLTTVLHRLVE